MAVKKLKEAVYLTHTSNLTLYIPLGFLEYLGMTDK